MADVQICNQGEASHHLYDWDDAEQNQKKQIDHLIHLLELDDLWLDIWRSDDFLSSTLWVNAVCSNFLPHSIQI